MGDEEPSATFGLFLGGGEWQWGGVYGLGEDGYAARARTGGEV